MQLDSPQAPTCVVSLNREMTDFWSVFPYLKGGSQHGDSPAWHLERPVSFSLGVSRGFILAAGLGILCMYYHLDESFFFAGVLPTLAIVAFVY